jgi:hypothetical protein
MIYKTIEEWIERNPNHIGAIPIEVCRQIWGTKDAQNMASKSNYKEQLEGWVKIDEVREHFESVSCGTIYKNGGEGRVPLYTAPQRTWIGLTKMELIKCGVFPWGNSYQLYEAIEAKLKEKNHG